MRCWHLWIGARVAILIRHEEMYNRIVCNIHSEPNNRALCTACVPSKGNRIDWMGFCLFVIEIREQLCQSLWFLQSPYRAYHADASFDLDEHVCNARPRYFFFNGSASAISCIWWKPSRVASKRIVSRKMDECEPSHQNPTHFSCIWALGFRSKRKQEPFLSNDLSPLSA